MTPKQISNMVLPHSQFLFAAVLEMLVVLLATILETLYENTILKVLWFHMFAIFGDSPVAVVTSELRLRNSQCSGATLRG